MATPIEINNRIIRHEPGSPRSNRRLRTDITLVEAQTSLENGARLAAFAPPRSPYTIHRIDDVTDQEDGARFPIYPPEALASVRLRRQIRKERGLAAVIMAVALGIGTTVAYLQDVPASIGRGIASQFDATLTYLERPQLEKIEEFRRNANRFHSQR